MAMPVRVGVVGAGFAASFHLRCYRQVQGVPVEVAAIVDVNKARAEELAKVARARAEEFSKEVRSRGESALDAVRKPASKKSGGDSSTSS